MHDSVLEADGVAFASRCMSGCCVAIFERAFERLLAAGISELARRAEFLEALDDYHNVLTGPPGRKECAGRKGGARERRDACSSTVSNGP